MQTGAVLSQNEVGDAGAIRAYAQAVQELGYDFLVSADHVVGAQSLAVDSQEKTHCKEGGALVAIDEGVVLRNAKPVCRRERCQIGRFIV